MLIERLDPKEDSKSEVYYEHLERYLFAKKFVKGKKILDIACGAGYGSEILAQGRAKEVVGVDISNKAIKKAAENYQAETLKFYQGLAEDIKWPENYFDIVVSFETIEHIDNQDLFLKEVKRVLKPAGLFIISTPNRILTSCYLIYRQPFNKFHKREYAKNEFLSILNKNFAIIDIYGQRSVCSLIVPYLIRKPLEKFFRFFCPRMERKIYYQCNGPVVQKVKLFKSPTYFIVVAENNYRPLTK